MRGVSLIFPLLRSMVSPVSGQVLRGRVYDALSERAVAGATVVLIDATGAEKLRVQSDSAGRFRLPASRAGRYGVRVEHVAYGVVPSELLRLDAGEVVEVSLPLRPVVIGLAPLRVLARRSGDRGRLSEYYDRLEWYGSLGVGRFLQRSELERMSGSRPSDVLRTVARVRVQSRGLVTTIVLSDGCVPLIALDGVRLQQRAQADFDSFITLRELEGVEIYLGAAETPPEYQNPCGAILFWSRAHAADSPRLTWRRLAGLGATAVVLLLLLR